MLNPSLLDYKLPTALDVPPIETVIVEVPSRHHPYGARGVGEAPIVPPPAAIANAIAAATGKRVARLPMTPGAGARGHRPHQGLAGVKVVLVNPPLCDPTMPYVAVPLLAAWLRGRGIEVLSVDANAEAVRWLMQPARLELLLDRARGRWRRLDAAASLGHAEQLEYAALARALGVGAGAAVPRRGGGGSPAGAEGRPVLRRRCLPGRHGGPRRRPSRWRRRCTIRWP